MSEFDASRLQMTGRGLDYLLGDGHEPADDQGCIALMATAAIFDAGKTRLKLSFVNQEGETLAVRTQAARPGPSAGPWPSLDLENAESFLRDGLATEGRASIDRIVPVGHGAAAVWLGRDGPIVPPIDYEAEVPAAISERYDAMRPAFSETGSPALPRGLNLGRQLFWALQEKSDLLESAKFVPWPQYWAWRLGGVAASEISSLGCHTDLWSVRNSIWSSMASELALDRACAPLHSAEDVLGYCDAEILCGAHDSNAALHALRLSPVGRDAALVSTGTWIVVMAPGDALALDPARDCLINVAIDGTLVPTARFMGGREFAQLSPGRAAADSEACAALVASDTMAIPPFSTLGGPFLGGQGEVVGGLPSDARGRAALAAAYLALMTDYCLDLVGARGPVVVEGPFADNEAGLGLLAALRNGEVLKSGADLVALGGAALAFGKNAVRDLQLTRIEPWELKGWRDYAATWRRRAEARREPAVLKGVEA